MAIYLMLKKGKKGSTLDSYKVRTRVERRPLNDPLTIVAFRTTETHHTAWKSRVSIIP